MQEFCLFVSLCHVLGMKLAYTTLETTQHLIFKLQHLAFSAFFCCKASLHFSVAKLFYFLALFYFVLFLSNIDQFFWKVVFC